MVLPSSHVELDTLNKTNFFFFFEKASVYSKYKTFPLKDYPCSVTWIILNQALISQTNWFIRLADLVVESLVLSNPKVHT